eukprot:311642-Pleurochrysis_carterae.AAC.1
MAAQTLSSSRPAPTARPFAFVVRQLLSPLRTADPRTSPWTRARTLPSCSRTRSSWQPLRFALKMNANTQSSFLRAKAMKTPRNSPPKAALPLPLPV